MSLLTASTVSAPPSLSPASNLSSENDWLCSTFGLPHSAACTSEFYAQAKLQHKARRFNLAVKCLEIYVARLVQQQQQQGKKAQQSVAAAKLPPSVNNPYAVPPPPNSLSSSSSSKKTPNSLPIPPLHLLAFCHYGAGDLLKSRECFLACVRLGFDPDWQMLVQLELELSSSLRASAEREARAGKDAVATLRKHLEQSRKFREGHEEGNSRTTETEKGEGGDEEEMRNRAVEQEAKQLAKQRKADSKIQSSRSSNVSSDVSAENTDGDDAASAVDDDAAEDAAEHASVSSKADDSDDGGDGEKNEEEADSDEEQQASTAQLSALLQQKGLNDRSASGLSGKATFEPIPPIEPMSGHFVRR